MSKPSVTVNNNGGASAAAIAGMVSSLGMVTVGVVAIAAMFLTVALVSLVAIVGLVVYGVRSGRRFALDRQLALAAWQQERPPAYTANGAGVWPEQPPARALVHSWRQQHPRPHGRLLLEVVQLLRK